VYNPSDRLKKDIPSRVYDFSNYTILIAEDIEINREIMTAILEETGAGVKYAENGNIAVSMFKTDPGKYSLILMDINMPEMDGYEATRQIRALDFAKAKDIPIIAMTANVFKEDIEKCIESGMNGHTGKPIDADELFEQLSKYLKEPAT
jgi:CheY-like chemotaxis protein